MRGISNTGTDTPATFGGPKFKPRQLSHAAEGGTRWSTFGVNSEYRRLRRVLLAVPGPELAVVGAADESLFLDVVSVERAREQYEALKTAYEKAGVIVVPAQSSVLPPPNFIFLRDAVFPTPEGMLIGRLASEQRAGEERQVAEVLALAGLPIVGMVIGDGLFEAADALWYEPDRVLIATGKRTNARGAAMVATLLAMQGVTTHIVQSDSGVLQHLLGVLQLVDERMAVADGRRCPPAVLKLLRQLDYQIVCVDDEEELLQHRALNFVVLEPRRVLMPSNAPRTRAALGRAGIDATAVDVSEYIKAGGGMACATAVLEREPCVGSSDRIQNREIQ